MEELSRARLEEIQNLYFADKGFLCENNFGALFTEIVLLQLEKGLIKDVLVSLVDGLKEKAKSKEYKRFLEESMEDVLKSIEQTRRKI